MLKSRIKDLKIRLAFHNFEKKNLMQNFIFINIMNKNINFYCKIVHFFIKGSKSRKNSKTKITRRCLLNNRSRGVARTFGLSRICLRELLQFGRVPGYSKAIW
jgi:ribosomal protein S14